MVKLLTGFNFSFLFVLETDSSLVVIGTWCKLEEMGLKLLYITTKRLNSGEGSTSEACIQEALYPSKVNLKYAAISFPRHTPHTHLLTKRKYPIRSSLALGAGSA